MKQDQHFDYALQTSIWGPCTIVVDMVMRLKSSRVQLREAGILVETDKRVVFIPWTRVWEIELVEGD